MQFNKELMVKVKVLESKKEERAKESNTSIQILQ